MLIYWHISSLPNLWYCFNDFSHGKWDTWCFSMHFIVLSNSSLMTICLNAVFQCWEFVISTSIDKRRVITWHPYFTYHFHFFLYNILAKNDPPSIIWKSQFLFVFLLSRHPHFLFACSYSTLLCNKDYTIMSIS